MLLEPIEMMLSGRVVEKQDIGDVTVYSASIKPYGDSYAFSYDCQVEQIQVRLGEYVEAGQVLAVMESSAFEEEKEQISRELEWQKKEDVFLTDIAMTDVEMARLHVDMMEANAGSSVDAKQAVEESRKELEAQEEQVLYDSQLRKVDIEEKQKLINNSGDKWNNRYLVAEKSGYVTYVKEFSSDNPTGQVSAEEIVVMLSDKKEAYVAADVVSAKAQEADQIYIEVEGKRYDLTYSPYSDQEKRIANNAKISLESRFVFEEGIEQENLIGKITSLYMVSNQKKQVLSVAPDSLFNENGEYFVYVLVDGKKEKRTVVPGVYTENAIEITEGLEEGERVYYPTSDLPGKKYSLVTLEESLFTVEKNYSQTNIKRPSAMSVLVKPEIAVLKEIKVKNGDEVKQGDVLAVLSVEEGIGQTTGYQLELEELKTSYEYQRMLDNNEMKKKETRRQTMRENQKEGTLEYKVLSLEIAKLQYQMQLADEEYRYQSECIRQNMNREDELTGTIEVTAPQDGIVSDMTSVAVGYSLTKDTLLCKIADASFQCAVIYEEKDVIPSECEVTIDLYNTDKSYHGKVLCAYKDAVRTVYNDKRILTEEVEQMKNIVYVSLEEDVSYEEIFPFEIRCALMQEENAIVIPSRAMYTENNRRYVWIMKDDQMEKRYVTLGYNNGNETWIIQGLSVGEQIVVEE